MICSRPYRYFSFMQLSFQYIKTFGTGLCSCTLHIFWKKYNGEISQHCAVFELFQKCPKKPWARKIFCHAQQIDLGSVICNNITKFIWIVSTGNLDEILSGSQFLFAKKNTMGYFNSFKVEQLSSRCIFVCSYFKGPTFILFADKSF